MTFCSQITNDRYAQTRARKVLSRLRKLCLRAILATVGISGLVTGLQETVLAANLSVLSQSDSGFSTLSSESLRGLENRNHSQDYLTNFSQTKPLTERNPILLSRKAEASVIQVPEELLDLIKRVEVNTGGSSLDSDQLVKLRYRIDTN